MILNHEQVLSLLPDREKTAHKGDFGRVLLLCGSRGYTGAAYLASMGALRSGAGLVFLGVPECIYEIEAVKLNEAIVFPLPEEGGMLSAASIPEIEKRLPSMDAVLIGCGLGQSKDTREVVLWLLEHAKVPVVLDADGINLISEHRHVLRGRAAPTILTPHEGEFKRLGYSIGETRMDAARKAAGDFGCVMVLKGHESCITDGVLQYINPTGNPGMAVGGSGDLLSGIIVSLLGQGLSPSRPPPAGAGSTGKRETGAPKNGASMGCCRRIC